eukprot:scaffold25295_cov36-Phaeocystis_antarctica.AAC.1
MRHRGLCSANAMMLPGFRIVDVQSGVDNLVLENCSSRCPTCLARHRFSGRAVAQRWPRAVAAELGCCFAAARAVAGDTDTCNRSPAIQIHAIDTRGHACDIVQSIHTDVLVRQRPEA